MKKSLIAFAIASLAFGAFAGTVSISRPDGIVDLTDPVEGVAQGVASKDKNTSLNEGDASRAFDNGALNNTNTRFIAKKAHVCVAYTFNEAKMVNAYAITFMNDGYDVETRAPRAWKIYGSNDYIATSVNDECSNGTWTELASIADETDWSKGETRFYVMANSTAYRSYKFDFSENNGDGTWIVLGDLELFNYVTEVTVTIPEVAGGSATGAGVYRNDETITLTATPDEGYVFLSWSGLPKGVGKRQSTVSFCTPVSIEVTPIFGRAEDTVRYVDTKGNDGNAGTFESPLASVGKAVEQLSVTGGFVYVAPGTYVQTAQISVTNSISIIGTGSDPSQTVLRYNSNTYSYGKGARVLLMNDKEASISNVTLSEGMMGVGSGINYGGCVLLNAGVVSNCVIRNSYSRQASNPLPCGGGVYMDSDDALLTHCVISNCSVYANASWIGACGGGVHVKNGHVENSLVVDCHTHSDIASPSAANVTGGIYMVGGEAVNCTVVNCVGSRSGGIEISSAGNAVNCVSFGCQKKIQVTDSASGAKEIVTTSSPFVGDAGRFFYCASDATETYNLNSSVLNLTSDAFNDYTHADYAPAKGGALFDGGQTLSVYPELDLAGKPRVSGQSIDIGAFEGSDSSFLVVGEPDNYGDASPAFGVHTDLSGRVTATADSEYVSPDGNLRTFCDGWTLYVSDENGEWSFVTSGDGNSANFVIPNGASKLVWNYSREYKVTVDVVGAGEATCYEWVAEGASTAPVVTPDAGWYLYGWIDASGAKVEGDGTFEINEAVDLVALLLPEGSIAPVQYVATTGDDANGGWTPETPRRKVSAAVNTLSEYGEFGGDVWIAGGNYVEQTKDIQINHPIRVHGTSGNPDDVVIARSGGSPFRLFTLNSSGAFVDSVTVSNGYYQGQVSGSGMYIDENGGTVSNCVVRNCSISGGYMAKGAVYVKNLNGLVTHTIVKDCTISDENQWGGIKGAGIHLESGARAENCLVAACSTTTLTPAAEGSPMSVGGIYAGSSAKVKNCTVVNCRGTRTGGIYALDSASVVNCCVFGCDFAYPEDGEPDIGAKHIGWDGTAAVFDHCATDDDEAINTTCSLIASSSAFFNYEKGDYRPASKGELYNTGVTPTGWDALVDLDGKPRVIGKTIDIGCYEGQPGGFMVLIR